MTSIHLLLEGLAERSLSNSRTVFQKHKRFFHNCPSYLQHAQPLLVKSPQLIYNRDTGIVSDPTSGVQLFRSVIGLEIHAQLMVPTKLFSSAPTKHFATFFRSTMCNDADPNTLVSPFDLGYPGTLPILSQAAIQAAVQTAHALHCNIAPWSRFERKHYHYADLPLGYQVTQQRWPIARNGHLVCRPWVHKTTHPQDTKHTTATHKQQQDMPKVRRRGQRHVEKIEPNATNTNTPSEQKKEEPSPPQPKPTTFIAYIDRIQVEQDTGKTITVDSSSSLIDYNRAGCALIEIVFTPCISSAYEAASVVSTLQSLLRFIGTCDGKMEAGCLRCDLNISIAPVLSNPETDLHSSSTTTTSVSEFTYTLPLGTGHRVEVKNLNSLKQIIMAAEYEAIRQATQRLQYNPTKRETRTWDTKRLETIKMRDKGDAVDYRFMPEPDLPPVILNAEMLDGMTLESFLSTSVPELPMQVAKRLVDQDGLSEDMAHLISSDRSTLSFYESTVKSIHKALQDGPLSAEDAHRIPTITANWLCNDLFALIKGTITVSRSQSLHPSKGGKAINEDEDHDDDTSNNDLVPSVEHSRVDVARFSSLLVLLIQGSISSTQAKKILGIMFHEDFTNNAATIAQSKGWKLIKSLQELENMCRQVVFDPRNKDQLDQYRQGGKHIRKLTKFYVGEVMSLSGGNAHPEWLEVALERILIEANEHKGVE